MTTTNHSYTTDSRLTRGVAALLTALLVALSAWAEPAKPKRTRSRVPTSTQSAPARSRESLEQDRTATQQRISETATQLSNADRQLSRQLSRLNSLNADIEQSAGRVNRLRSDIDSLGSRITLQSDSIKLLERDLEGLRRAYARAMADMQPYARNLSAITFIFSAKSFTEAYARLRYIRRFNEWRSAKARAITEALDRVGERRKQLTGMRHQQDKAYREAAEAQSTLTRQQSESKQLVESLRKEQTQLKSVLAEQKRKARALDNELNRLIAAEQARIAREEAQRKKQQQQQQAAQKPSAPSKSRTEKSNADADADANPSAAPAPMSVAASTDPNDLTGSFRDNKGRLLFPVAGSYKVVSRFGRQPHPTLPHVETDNAGIDIEVAHGTQARAVFGGTVSYVIRQEGFNNIVMLRHGKYLTVYAGLGSVAVRQGQKVSAGQTLGSIVSEATDAPGRAILHFELRDERTKLNPQAWVR